ncbi:MAG: hypothetical protein N3J91_12510 [Verrucomicrobiae bacterium]|nr:hypothetical protein [Verrucomicrobiae bacterium]
MSVIDICLNHYHTLFYPASILIFGMLLLWVRHDQSPQTALRMAFSIGCYLVVQSAYDLTGGDLFAYVILGSIASGCIGIAWFDKLAQSLVDAIWGFFDSVDSDSGDVELAKEELKRLSRWAAEERHRKVIRVAERLLNTKRHNPRVLEAFIQRARLAVQEEEHYERQMKKGIFTTTIRLHKEEDR